MLDLTDELRVTNETPQTIKARLAADTNAGVDPNDAAYADTAPGSFWDDVEGAGALEWDRLYDRMNEVAAAAIPALSFGAFLDAWADSLGLTRNAAAPAGGVLTFSGADGTNIPIGTRASTPQTTENADPVEFETTAAGAIGVSGEVDIAVAAVVAGAAGKVPANTITLLDTPITGVAVTNAAATTGGADVETDESLQRRVLRKLGGAAGAGNVEQYVNWGLDYPGVGYVTVQPNTPSIGHVTVLITDLDNDPSPVAAVDGLQEILDPSATPTQGAGLAPVGATVHVATPTSFAVTVGAEVALEAGYSLDGAGGTRAVEDDIVESLRRYVDTLPVGGDVIRTKVVAAIVDVLGVADVTEATLDLNGSTSGNVAVSATQVASLSTTTLTV